MKTNLIALAAGLLFGFGLCLSHMADPNKVLAFLDIVGGWDPSLALVMGGALAVFMLAFPLIRRQPGPWVGATFHIPDRHDIDRRLMIGAALFGLGWGLAGYCPGPAIAALAINPHEAILFVFAVIVGGWAMRVMDTRRVAHA
ncbi:MAG: YeeE/YedE family protein [Salinisphaera sp.]|jgi:uncharacterized membrane protein YedE/YeeE|nr:YeeE/YedE family protein [Salinisphaera sp.]